jgi:hypothetical protein
MAQATVMKTRLDSKAGKIAKDPKVATRVARSLDAIRTGNTLDAFQALTELREHRQKASKRHPR